MDFQHFKNLYARSQLGKDYPARNFILSIYRKIYEGDFYEILPNPFNQVNKPRGWIGEGWATGVNYERVPMSERRPSVKSGLAHIVVDKSVSFLFDENHFPRIIVNEEETNQTLNKIVKESNLNCAMIEAATSGCVGSVAFVVKLLKGRFFYEILNSEFLTPRFDPESPNDLIKLTEKYKITAIDAANLGYKINKDDNNKEFWFMREFDKDGEYFYEPWLVSDESAKPKIDNKRSMIHNLGIMCAVWIKNLPGGTGPDGECTFKKAIDDIIQLDYQLSQAGRGLIYSSEPILYIKNPDVFLQGEVSLGEGQVLVGSENGDAKMVEINGDACRASLDYCKNIRDLALESMHSDRTNPEKLSGAQSGKALEILHQSIILLASRLRLTYGEFGLKKIITIILKLMQSVEVISGNEKVKINPIKNLELNLVWPQWFSKTSDDKYKEAETLSKLSASQIITKKTATEVVSDDYGIEDAIKESGQAKNEQIEFLDSEQARVSETIKA